ncbi:MAG TPA: 50S ribosomal protein L33 [Candidatus Saccharimonadales bacterium]|nr:50S ribosomal protein L33 [Candidatus Saccharimonadales bacterium]
MAKKSEKRKIVGLVNAAGERHYYTTKNTQNTPGKLEMMKYNPTTRKRELYKESAKNLGRNEVKKRK